MQTVQFLQGPRETKSDETVKADMYPKNDMFVKMLCEKHHRDDRLANFQQNLHDLMIRKGQAILASYVRRGSELKPRVEALSCQRDQLEKEVGRLLALVNGLDLRKVPIPALPRACSISRDETILCQMENMPEKKTCRVKSPRQNSCSFLIPDFDGGVKCDLTAPCGTFAGFKRYVM